MSVDKVTFRVPKGYKGYKIFNPDWTCIHMQYTCPGVFELENKDELEIKKCGFHFSTELRDCYNYYPEALIDPSYHVCEVKATGRVTYCKNLPDTPDTVRCTDKLEIVRELNKAEIDQVIYKQSLIRRARRLK